MKPATTVTSTTKVTPVNEKVLTTKHIAPRFGMKPQAFRRILRSMSMYADGKHTNYRWSNNDPALVTIAEFIKARTAEASKADAKAKAALPAAQPVKA